jgi:hypothetical protein
MLKFTLLVLLAATSISACASCEPSAFRGCTNGAVPIYAPGAPMPR